MYFIVHEKHVCVQHERGSCPADWYVRAIQRRSTRTQTTRIFYLKKKNVRPTVCYKTVCIYRVKKPVCAAENRVSSCRSATAGIYTRTADGHAAHADRLRARTTSFYPSAAVALLLHVS